MSIITNDLKTKIDDKLNELFIILSNNEITITPDDVKDFINRHGKKSWDTFIVNNIISSIVSCSKQSEPQQEEDDGMKEMLDLFNKLIQKYKIPASQNDELLRKAIEDAFLAYDVYADISAKINKAYPNSIKNAEDFKKYVEYYMNMASNVMLNNPMFDNIEALKQELSAYKTKYGELNK